MRRTMVNDASDDANKHCQILTMLASRMLMMSMLMPPVAMTIMSKGEDLKTALLRAVPMSVGDDPC